MKNWSENKIKRMEKYKIIKKEWETMENLKFYEKYKNKWEGIKLIMKREFDIKIFKEKIKKPIQPKKEPIKKGINAWNNEKIEQFKKDYLSLKNEDLEKIYNKCIVTLWSYSKKLGIKRNKKYYNDNVFNNLEIKTNWNKQQINHLKQYANNEYLSLEWAKEKTEHDKESIRYKAKSEGIKIKKRKKKNKKFTKKNLKNIRRSMLYMSRLDIIKKYNITDNRYRKIRKILNICDKLSNKNFKYFKNDMLKCTKCGEIKHKDYFHKEPLKKYIKYRSNCKDCKTFTKYKKDGINGDVTAEQLKFMKKYFKNKCAYCGEIITPKNYTLDHIIPKIKGGTNNINNLVIACFDCNTKKYTMNIEKFYDKSESFTKDNYNKIIEYKKLF